MSFSAEAVEVESRSFERVCIARPSGSIFLVRVIVASLVCLNIFSVITSNLFNVSLAHLFEIVLSFLIIIILHLSNVVDINFGPTFDCRLYTASFIELLSSLCGDLRVLLVLSSIDLILSSFLSNFDEFPLKLSTFDIVDDPDPPRN